MQTNFKHIAAPRRQQNGVRPLRLRTRLGWIVLCLLLVCIALTSALPVLAASTGAKVATSVVSSGSWSNFTVGYLNTSDDQRATNNTDNNYGIVSTFGFGVPAGVQIDGIQVDVEGSNSNNSKTVNYEVALSGNSGTGWTSAKADTFTGPADDTDTFGGDSDDWGWTWGAAGFSDATFRLRIYRTGGDFSLRVDLIQVTVYYSVASFTQAGFRGRNYDDDETAATWKAAADTNWTQKVDENFRVRYVVQETADISAADQTFFSGNVVLDDAVLDSGMGPTCLRSTANPAATGKRAVPDGEAGEHTGIIFRSGECDH